MQITARVFAAAAAVLTTFTATAPAAGADPGLSTPDHPFSVIDTAALPLPAAQWSPVLGYNRTDAVLSGIAQCSAEGVPAPVDLDARARASSPVFVADLHPENASGAVGWRGTISGASYPSVAASSYALASYRRYLDACRTAPGRPEAYRNGAVGTSVQDPTTAHALIQTAGEWVEVFAVATNDGLVEATFSRENDGPVQFEYNPAAVFGALKMADLGALSRPVG